MLSESAVKQDQLTRLNKQEADGDDQNIQLPEISGAKSTFENGMTHEQFMNLRDGYAKKLPET